MNRNKHSLFAPFGDLPPGIQLLFVWLSFLTPLVAWCVVSYVPFVWHPLMRVADPGGVSYFQKDTLVDKKVFRAENEKMLAAGKAVATGVPANPVFLPAPHEVAQALYKSFTTPPRRKGEPWLHESLWHSIRIIFWGFLLSSILGVPLGILCGTFKVFAKLSEPAVDFFRYMPAPVFGALAVAVLGIYDGPKVAIIVIGTFFQQVLVIANTTRKLDPSLVEAAQTLGAGQIQILFQVVLPGIAVDLYNDMRILIGCAWTFLIVAEYIGASSGITFFINQQAKYRIYDNVFAAILIIGVIGFATDRVLDWIGRRIFPWQKSSGRGGLLKALRESRRKTNPA